MLKQFIRYNRRAARWLESRFPKTFGWASYVDELKKAVSSDIEASSPSVVLEVGGIDRPLLEKSGAYDYVGLDIEEQPACHRVYDRFIVQSIEAPVPVSADLILSMTLMEHVPDNAAAVRSMFGALRGGGSTHHYIPSKWHPYAIATRIVSPSMQKRLIRHLRPEAVEVTGYPAFFDRCSPTSMRRLFEKAGFVDVKVTSYYRASDYFSFFLPAYLAIVAFENLCNALSLQTLASGFIISARKPVAASIAREPAPNESRPADIAA
jgi:SAM-dependent methyltransferase